MFIFCQNKQTNGNYAMQKGMCHGGIKGFD